MYNDSVYVHIDVLLCWVALLICSVLSIYVSIYVSMCLYICLCVYMSM